MKKTKSERSPKQLVNKIYCADALQRLRQLPESLVDCVVTSPPYFRQRDYDGAEQLGLESSPDEYVDRLVGLDLA